MTVEELEKALRFVLEHEAILQYDGKWRDGGCGCCSGEVTVPEDILNTIKELKIE